MISSCCVVRFLRDWNFSCPPVCASIHSFPFVCSYNLNYIGRPLCGPGIILISLLCSVKCGDLILSPRAADFRRFVKWLVTSASIFFCLGKEPPLSILFHWLRNFHVKPLHIQDSHQWGQVGFLVIRTISSVIWEIVCHHPHSDQVACLLVVTHCIYSHTWRD